MINYQITKDQSKRINILKMLFTLFVVYIHCNPTTVKFSSGTIQTDIPFMFGLFKYTLSEIIPRCSVFGFFLISSILLYRKSYSWKINLIKKTKSIIVPYLIMNTLWIVLYAIFQEIPQTKIFFANENSIVANFDFIRWLEAYGIGSELPFLYPLWFLRNLFILNCFSVLIKYLLDRIPKYVDFLLVFFFFIGTTNCIYFNVTDISAWCFGYLFVKHNINIDVLDNKREKILFLYLFTLVFRIIAWAFEMTGLLSLFLNRFTLLISVIFWYSCFTKNESGFLQRIFYKLSSYSFAIYIFHEMSLTFIIRLFAKLFGTSISLIVVEYVCLPIVVVIIVIIFSYIFKKTLPRLFYCITGSR